MIAVILIGFTPFLSTYAASQEYYHFLESNKQISYIDLSDYFQDYNGTFVLYDSHTDEWKIYNKELATTRIAPNSTYKIYEGLMGLDSGIINPNQNQIAWDGTNQPFATWNKNQDLSSAMQNSVNWYFEKIGASVGSEHIKEYL